MPIPLKGLIDATNDELHEILELLKHSDMYPGVVLSERDKFLLRGAVGRALLQSNSRVKCCERYCRWKTDVTGYSKETHTLSATEWHVLGFNNEVYRGDANEARYDSTSGKWEYRAVHPGWYYVDSKIRLAFETAAEEPSDTGAREYILGSAPPGTLSYYEFFLAAFVNGTRVQPELGGVAAFSLDGQSYYSVSTTYHIDGSTDIIYLNAGDKLDIRVNTFYKSVVAAFLINYRGRVGIKYLGNKSEII